MDKKKIFVLIIAATMLTAANTAFNPLTIPTHQTQTNPTRNPITTPPQAEWNKTYGGDNMDYAFFVQETSDGGYIIAGRSYSFGDIGYQAWLVKTNSTGHHQWNRTYGGTDDDAVAFVQQTSDGGYIMAGYTESYADPDGDAWLVKTNSTGHHQWNKTYGGTDYDIVKFLQVTSDGGYIMAGDTKSYGVDGYDAWLVKTNSTGHHQWNKTYGGINNDQVNSVQVTSDGGYIMAGYTNSFGAGSYDAWLVKTNSTGHHQWNKTYGGTNTEQTYSVQVTSDGGYIIAGYRQPSGPGSSDAWLVKTNSTGHHQWNKTYGGANYDIAYSLQLTLDGGYIMAGYTTSFGAVGYDAWLAKTDATGNHQWNKTYGGIGEEQAYSVQQTSDGGYIVAGVTSSFGAVMFDIWLLKTEDGTPPSTVTDLTAGGSTRNSTTLTWTAPGDEWNTGTAAAYEVKYSTSGVITDANWTSATTYTQSWTPLPAGSTENQVVSGFSPATTYWFAVRAYDEVPNYSDVSNSPSATTLEATAPEAVDDLVASPLNSTAVTLNWTAPGDDGASGTAAGYQVRYSTAGSISEANWSSATGYTQSWVPIAGGGIESRIVSGLSPNTRYWFAIKAFDEVPNYGACSNSPNATTTTTGAPAGGLPVELIIVVGVVAVAVLGVVVFVAMKRRK